VVIYFYQRHVPEIYYSQKKYSITGVKLFSSITSMLKIGPSAMFSCTNLHNCARMLEMFAFAKEKIQILAT
jgi:hypothetical protein